MRNNTISIESLFADELKDVLNAEQQILKALPNVIKAAQSPDLVDALKTHLEETRGQVDRLEQIFGSLDISGGRETCQAR